MTNGKEPVPGAALPLQKLSTHRYAPSSRLARATRALGVLISLGQVLDTHLVPLLLILLHDAEPAVTHAALDGLRALASHRFGSRAAASALLGPMGVDVAADAVDDNNAASSPSTSLVAARATSFTPPLAPHHVSKLLPSLQDLATSRHWRMRHATARAVPTLILCVLSPTTAAVDVVASGDGLAPLNGGGGPAGGDGAAAASSAVASGSAVPTKSSPAAYDSACRAIGELCAQLTRDSVEAVRSTAVKAMCRAAQLDARRSSHGGRQGVGGNGLEQGNNSGDRGGGSAAASGAAGAGQAPVASATSAATAAAAAGAGWAAVPSVCSASGAWLGDVVLPCLCVLAQSRRSRERSLGLVIVRSLLPLTILEPDALTSVIFPLLAAAATDAVPNIRLGAVRALEVLLHAVVPSRAAPELASDGEGCLKRLCEDVDGEVRRAARIAAHWVAEDGGAA